jgi:hypothetical protein
MTKKKSVKKSAGPKTPGRGTTSPSPHPLVAFLPKATTEPTTALTVPSLEPQRDQTLDDLRAIVALLRDDKSAGRPSRTAASISRATGIPISIVGVDLTILMLNGTSLDGRAVMIRENPATPTSAEPTYELLE